MKPQHLSLVPTLTLLPQFTTPLATLAAAVPASVPIPGSDRKVFWKTFLAWLAVATDDEADRLDRALAQHAHHVRPLVDALSDALREPATASLLPATLLADLLAAGWKPSPRAAARAA